MKKTLVSLILGSLLFPYITLAQEAETTTAPVRVMPVSAQLEGRERAPLRQQERTLEKRMELRASSTLPLKAAAKNLGFCQEIDKALAYIDTKSIKMEDKRNDNLTNRGEKREEIRTKVDEKREENDTKRKSQMEELAKRATTDTQKQAVTAFQTAMEKALASKKAATDAVIASHRTEVDNIVTSRKGEIEKAITALKTSIEAAKTKAKSDCAGGTTAEQVRSTLRASIEKAQGDFKTTVTSIEKVKDVSIASKENKKIELKKIEDTFKASMEKAKMDLKAALKGSSTTNPAIQ